MPHPLVAFPESNRVLRRHLGAALCLGSSLAVVTFLPFLARRHFAANNWQTTVITAAVPVMQFFSIFWNHYYARVSIRAYLAALALLACAPIAVLGLAPNIWVLLAAFVVAAFGSAGMSPLNADVLRSCYAPHIRGRVFGLVTTAQMLSALLAGLLVGAWSARDAEAFRWFLPLLAAVQMLGLFLIDGIARQPLFHERLRPLPLSAPRWWSPLRDMTAVLREDRRFAAYEVAFMSYGVGWMVCTALVPALATDRLHLTEAQFAHATIVAYQVAHVLMLALAGRLADRIGPVRLASISFLWLTIYPLGLLTASGLTGLSISTVLYALGMAGVHLTWTLGPVSLAADPARASQYLAIHTTLVGVRGILAQGLGMVLYSVTGSFTIPLLGAAAAFLWAARRMHALGEHAR